MDLFDEIEATTDTTKENVDVTDKTTKDDAQQALMEDIEKAQTIPKDAPLDVNVKTAEVSEKLGEENKSSGNEIIKSSENEKSEDSENIARNEVNDSTDSSGPLNDTKASVPSTVSQANTQVETATNVEDGPSQKSNETTENEKAAAPSGDVKSSGAPSSQTTTPQAGGMMKILDEIETKTDADLKTEGGTELTQEEKAREDRIKALEMQIKMQVAKAKASCKRLDETTELLNKRRKALEVAEQKARLAERRIVAMQNVLMKTANEPEPPLPVRAPKSAEVKKEELRYICGEMKNIESRSTGASDASKYLEAKMEKLRGEITQWKGRRDELKDMRDEQKALLAEIPKLQDGDQEDPPQPPPDGAE